MTAGADVRLYQSGHRASARAGLAVPSPRNRT